MSLKKLKNKILGYEHAQNVIEFWNANNERIVLTNGCFDLIHMGHIDYLAKASSLGTKFVVAINSDASVCRLKGNSRPIKDELTRALVMASFEFVDLVVVFEEDTPLELIKTLLPGMHILVKGGDYQIDEIAGVKEIMENHGSVVLLPFLPGHSTSLLEAKIKNS